MFLLRVPVRYYRYPHDEQQQRDLHGQGAAQGPGRKHGQGKGRGEEAE